MLVNQPKPPSIDDDEKDLKPAVTESNGETKPVAKAKVKAKKVKATKVKAEKKTKAPKVKAEKKEISLKDVEKGLVERYTKQDIVAGSLRDVGTIKEFGNKRSIEIKCQDCQTKRRIATSDLHQTCRCEECIKTVRLERRKGARGSSKKAKGKKKAKATA
jgi:hypothetical protein